MKNIFVLILIVGFFTDMAQAQLTTEQHQKLVSTSRWLSRFGITYCEDWRPPGESQDWEMDCSNTVRYLYRQALGKELPRTASDQYYTLKQQNLVVEAPHTADGEIDTKALLPMLRSGDLLFWEWTYNIKRTPPVSHVMIYLGQTKDGTPKMTGSTCRTWGDKRRRGGVDVYTFNPNAPAGGVKNLWGDYIQKGRFVGFGRPLAATHEGTLAATKKEQDSESQ